MNQGDNGVEIITHKKRERQQIINELRLVPKKDSYF